MESRQHAGSKPESAHVDPVASAFRRPVVGAVLYFPGAGAVRVSVFLLVPAGLGADHFAADLAGLSQPRPRRISITSQGKFQEGCVMADRIDWIALAIFLFFFALVTVMGFFAARWKSGPVSAHLDEWGLGGRQFGTWITWFLVGGDFYTAYTVIAVPALVYAVGAYGFFALPYTIIVYPFVFAVMPVLSKTAHTNGYVTAADVVHGAYGSRGLELPVAITGMVATLPSIALPLIGMGVTIKGLSPTGDPP